MSVSPQSTACSPHNYAHVRTHPTTPQKISHEDVFANEGVNSPLKIRQDIINKCYQKSSSQTNFAVQLVRECFTHREREESNCNGDKRYGKSALSPNRLQAVQKAVFAIRPIRPGENKENVWKPFKDAINESCRRLNKFKKTSVLDRNKYSSH